jgi:hypothetical protein
MNLQAINRISSSLATAREDYEATKRLVRGPVAQALFEPTRPAVHAAGLAAWIAFVEELHGDHDADWLHL